MMDYISSCWLAAELSSAAASMMGADREASSWGHVFSSGEFCSDSDIWFRSLCTFFRAFPLKCPTVIIPCPDWATIVGTYQVLITTFSTALRMASRLVVSQRSMPKPSARKSGRR